MDRFGYRVTPPIGAEIETALIVMTIEPMPAPVAPISRSAQTHFISDPFHASFSDACEKEPKQRPYQLGGARLARRQVSDAQESGVRLATPDGITGVSTKVDNCSAGIGRPKTS